MTDAVQKLSVYDDRIVQTQPRYAVEKGALSLTNAPYTALSQSASQHTYNITVPSEGVFIDRAVDWVSTCFLQFQAVPSAFVANAPVVVIGRDLALAPFPLTTLVQTMSATINDATVTTNTGDVLHELLRLVDYNKNRVQRQCPTMLDTYGSYNDAFGTVRNPLGDYMSSTSRENIPNGAWGQITFTNPAGQSLSGTGTYLGLNGETVNFVSGVPVQPASAPPASYSIFVQFRSTEKLVLSPFIFSDIHEMDTGMFGVQNIQLVMNLTNPSQTSTVGRVLRSCSKLCTVSAVAYNGGVANQGGSPFANSRLNVQFLTPSLSIPLPAKSIVPYYEFPRYVSNQNLGANGITHGQSAQVQSQTITLPCIPDLLLIYCKPQQYLPTDADWYLPISQISVNFDNFSGLLSTMTQEQLYTMSVMNGLEMDFNTWLGYTTSANQEGASPPNDSKTQLCGGFLVLKPSKDITLQEGQAPSVVGNYTLQFNATVNNWSNQTVTNATLYIVTCNSGYFETVKGSSRVIKGVLNEADVINAPMSSAGTRSNLMRIIGGRSALHRLGNVLGRVKEFAGAKSGGAMSAGAESGGAESGGATSGGARRRGAMGLAGRLM